MNIINLTPHAVVIRAPSGASLTIPSSGVARVGSTPGAPLDGQVLMSDPQPVLYAAPTWGAVEGLPEPIPGTIYIVSAMVAARCVGRSDVFSPGTGPTDGAFRNESGQIEAVSRLIQAPQA